MRKVTLGARFALALMAGTALAGSISASKAEEAKNGGSYTIVYKDDLNTLDPAIGYDFQNWSTIKAIFDGLMDYKHGTNDLIPDLAESYTISPDGKTYTFKLRHGVKFQNGREMKAADVKYSIERAVNPKTQSPGPAISRRFRAMTTWSIARPPSSAASPRRTITQLSSS